MALLISAYRDMMNFLVVTVIRWLHPLLVLTFVRHLAAEVPPLSLWDELHATVHVVHKKQAACADRFEDVFVEKSQKKYTQRENSCSLAKERTFTDVMRSLFSDTNIVLSLIIIIYNITINFLSATSVLRWLWQCH